MCCWVCYVVIFFSVTNTRQWFIVVVTEHESDTFQLAFDLKKQIKSFINSPESPLLIYFVFSNCWRLCFFLFLQERSLWHTFIHPPHRHTHTHAQTLCTHTRFGLYAHFKKLLGTSLRLAPVPCWCDSIMQQICWLYFDSGWSIDLTEGTLQHGWLLLWYLNSNMILLSSCGIQISKKIIITFKCCVTLETHFIFICRVKLL